MTRRDRALIWVQTSRAEGFVNGLIAAAVVDRLTSWGGVVGEGFGAVVWTLAAIFIFWREWYIRRRRRAREAALSTSPRTGDSCQSDVSV